MRAARAALAKFADDASSLAKSTDDVSSVTELDANKSVAELPGDEKKPTELSTESAAPFISELPGSTTFPKI